MRADAGADAGADSKSCDLSEPIRCAKVVSAPENPLSHLLLHPLSCICSHLSCDLSEPIRFAIYLSAPASALICDG